MKMNTGPITIIEREGVTHEGHFKIAATSKAFKILGDSLYSDKIKSIIRELSCNASDSHIEAGCETRPIEVHLPNSLEPYFRVTDYGVGLSHNEVTEIYTTYFSSTKTESNFLTGALGLGSKSPFSYCRAFTVTAIKNGIKNSYSMHYDENDIPQVSLLGSSKTTESNGVAVELPVNRHDIQEFADKAASVYRWFPVKPVITGYTDVSIKSVDECLFSGTGWRVVKPEQNRSYYSHRDNVIAAKALMGKVAYEININSVTDLEENMEELLKMPLVMDFKIGDLEIAASREALGYDTRTINAIKAKLRIVLKELIAELEKKIAGAKTEWEAHKMFGEIFNHEYGFYYSLQHILGRKGLMWNGKKIDGNYIRFETNTVWGDKDTPSIGHVDGYQKRINQTKYHTGIHIICNDHTEFLFNDMDHGGLSRVHYYREEKMKSGANRNLNIYVIGPSTLKKTPTDIVAILGHPTSHKLVSTLPKRPPAAKADKVDMLSYSGYGRNSKSSWRREEDVDIEDGGVYVMLDGWKVVQDDKEVSMFEDIVSLARNTGVFDQKQKLYSPRGVFKRRISKHAEWVDLFTHVKTGLQAKLTPELLQALANAKELELVTDINEKIWNANWTLKDKNSDLLAFANAMKMLTKTTNGTKLDRNLTRLLTITNMDKDLKLPVPTVKVADLAKKVQEKYGMLELVINQYSSYTFATSVPKIQEYVDIVDSYHATKV